MDPIVDFWEMPPGWGVSGTAPLQHTQGQCVVWLSDTNLSSSPFLVTSLDLTHLWPWIKIGAEKLKTKIFVL